MHPIYPGTPIHGNGSPYIGVPQYSGTHRFKGTSMMPNPTSQPPNSQITKYPHMQKIIKSTSQNSCPKHQKMEIFTKCESECMPPIRTRLRVHNSKCMEIQQSKNTHTNAVILLGTCLVGTNKHITVHLLKPTTQTHGGWNIMFQNDTCTRIKNSLEKLCLGYVCSTNLTDGTFLPTLEVQITKSVPETPLWNAKSPFLKVRSGTQ